MTADARSADTVPTQPTSATAPPARGIRTPARGWLIAAMLCVLMTINFADKSVLGLAAEPLMRDLGLTASQFGLAGSIFFLLFGVTGVVVGFLGNRFTSTRLLLVIALAWSVSMMPLLLFPSLAGLLVNRLLLGAAEGPTAPLASHAVQKWFSDSRRAVPASLVNLGAGLGIAIAAPVLTYLITNFGWQSAIWCMAVVSLVWAAGWKLVGREGPLDTYDSAADLPGDHTPAAEVRVPYRRLFAASSWWAPILVLAPGYFSFAVFSVWGPSYFVSGLGYSPGTVGWLIAVYGLVMAFGHIFFSWLSGVLVRRGVGTRWARGVYMGVVVCLCGELLVVAVAMGTGPWAAGLLLVSFGFAGTVHTIGFLLVAESSPVGQRSAMLSSFNSVVTAFAVIAPFVAGVLVDTAATPTDGYRTAFLWCGILLIVGGLAGAVFIRPDRDTRRLGLRGTDSD
ncbi:MFS transporter [Rhodococcus sp. NPDC059968]|uniref:MFS transporter n=1 Tax=Rhodococcus sp. NPDC059968 TaxID=3347017 RepID=UPI0036707287